MSSQPYSIFSVAMPKQAHSDKEWEAKLTSLRYGHLLGKGEAPPPNSKYYDRYKKISACPLTHSQKGQRTLFQKPVPCKCGEHKSAVSIHSFVILLRIIQVLLNQQP